jgi:hypothetical protein
MMVCLQLPFIAAHSGKALFGVSTLFFGGCYARR